MVVIVVLPILTTKTSYILAYLVIGTVIAFPILKFATAPISLPAGSTTRLYVEEV